MRSFLWAAGGTLFTFLMTALGAALVFLFRARIGARMNRLSLGFSGGVMSAASVFSLLLPAMAQAQDAAWRVATFGFLAGAGLMAALDACIARRLGTQSEDGRRMLLLFAVTLHNIPEGMAVGLALGAAGGASLAGACALTLGIAVQNVPEGAAISLPLRQSGMSRRRSFALGALSGAVEPLFGVPAALLAGCVRAAMPWLMAFSAGAMTWVVFSEMLPDAGRARDGVLAALFGYALMMALDIALG